MSCFNKVVKGRQKLSNLHRKYWDHEKSQIKSINQVPHGLIMRAGRTTVSFTTADVSAMAVPWRIFSLEEESWILTPRTNLHRAFPFPSPICFHEHLKSESALSTELKNCLEVVQHRFMASPSSPPPPFFYFNTINSTTVELGGLRH